MLDDNRTRLKGTGKLALGRTLLSQQRRLRLVVRTVSSHRSVIKFTKASDCAIFVSSSAVLASPSLKPSVPPPASRRDGSMARCNGNEIIFNNIFRSCPQNISASPLYLQALLSKREGWNGHCCGSSCSCTSSVASQERPRSLSFPCSLQLHITCRWKRQIARSADIETS